MKLLLDTHIWLWSRLDPKRLGRAVRRQLDDPRHEFWLSPLSSWEAALLARKGKLQVAGDWDAWFSEAVAPFREAPLTHGIVRAARGISFEHGDPADRLLAATALHLGLTLVTADHRLLGLAEIRTLANV